MKVIGGAKSPYISKQNVVVLKEVFPNLDLDNEFVLIEGAGHWVHAEKTSEFIEELSKFLK